MRHNCDKKHFRVIIRQGNYSHFEKPKGKLHHSDYSLLECLKCGHMWRTKAKYVSGVKDE